MEGFYDDRANVLDDIALGRAELIKLKFDYESDIGQELLYELYCVPSHNEQAYYAQIFRKCGECYLSYAKSVIEDFVINETIYMYTLRDAVEANDKNRYYGKIVCGYKKVTDEYISYLSELCTHLPDENQWNEEGSVCLDGTFQMIRVYSDGSLIKEIAFHNQLKSVMDLDAGEKLATLNQYIEREFG